MLCAFFLTGCDEPVGTIRTRTADAQHCTPDTVQKRADFILECVVGGNPKSDEEPEDWIGICQTMAEETFCPVVPMNITEECSASMFGDCNWWIVRTRVPVGT